MRWVDKGGVVGRGRGGWEAGGKAMGWLCNFFAWIIDYVLRVLCMRRRVLLLYS